MDHGSESDGLRKRLDVIIQLLLEANAGGVQSVTEKIHRLLGFGLTQSEVAEVLGKKLNYVTAAVATRKRSGPKKKTENLEQSET